MTQLALILTLSGLMHLAAALHLLWRTRATNASRTIIHNRVILGTSIVVSVVGLGYLSGAVWIAFVLDR